MLKPAEDLRDRIWLALEQGAVHEALALSERWRPAAQDGEGRLLQAIVLLEAGLVKQAYHQLLDLAAISLSEDDEFARRVHLAQAALGLGEPAEGLRLLDELKPATDDERGTIYWWSGLCHDHLGDSDRADRCFSEAQRVDPEGNPAPIPITPDDLAHEIRQVIAELPEPLQATFEEVPVVTQDLPGLDLIRKSRGTLAPDTLGLYVGSHLLERSHLDPGGYPATIFLYRRNLERFVRDRDELADEIRTTLLHELGHHLGYEEEDLEGLGLG